jgi:integrase
VTTVAAAPVAVPPSDPRTGQLIAVLDPAFLAVLGWDWELRVLFFPPAHPVLGRPSCKVTGCDKPSVTATGLCSGCGRAWKACQKQDADDFQAFLDHGPHWQRVVGTGRCHVPGCPRPWKTEKSRLCMTHHYQRTVSLKLPLEEFLRHPQVGPPPSHGMCTVTACYRQLNGPRASYCHAHAVRWGKRSGTAAPDEEEAWRRTESPIAVSGEVSLRGLPHRVVAEILYMLQDRTGNGIKTRSEVLRTLCDYLRRAGVATVDDADHGTLRPHHSELAAAVSASVRRLGATPETERHKDTWDLAVLGRPGRLHFEKVRHPAFKEALKTWALDDLPRRRGRGSRGTTQSCINAIIKLLDSLHDQRPDRGLLLADLGRQDMLAFRNRVAFLAGEGRISAHHEVIVCREVRRVLMRMRALGLTAAGQPLHGLPPDFTLDIADLPDEPEDSQAGHDLPDEVMRVLCDGLDLLESMASAEIRVAAEVIIDTGRRPAEICQLPYDCLQRDPDGSLVLLYDNHKNYRNGRRLPIGASTGGVITRQQQRVRAGFPDTAAAELKLLPAPARNPDGRRAIAGITEQHRSWVRALPDMTVSVTVDADGQAVRQMLPFDKAKIYPYAYRHTYTQRHADAGVEVDVLRQLSTTQRYYQVRDKRKRQAVEKVTALQFDRHGNRIWRGVTDVLDSEHMRRGIGEVAVPYGMCIEPGNVAAGGTACPVRFRCVGCGHFRTDVSYLPDLEAYLADLRRSRERLLGAFDADPWAIAEAMPSEEEIRRVKRLIDRVKADLDDLTEQDRAEIQQAVAMVRRSRSVMLGMPRLRPAVVRASAEGSA